MMQPYICAYIWLALVATAAWAGVASTLPVATDGGVPSALAELVVVDAAVIEVTPPDGLTRAVGTLKITESYGARGPRVGETFSASFANELSHGVIEDGVPKVGERGYWALEPDDRGGWRNTRRTGEWLDPFAARRGVDTAERIAGAEKVAILLRKLRGASPSVTLAALRDAASGADPYLAHFACGILAKGDDDTGPWATHKILDALVADRALSLIAKLALAENLWKRGASWYDGDARRSLLRSCAESKLENKGEAEALWSCINRLGQTHRNSRSSIEEVCELIRLASNNRSLIALGEGGGMPRMLNKLGDFLRRDGPGYDPADRAVAVAFEEEMLLQMKHPEWRELAAVGLERIGGFSDDEIQRIRAIITQLGDDPCVRELRAAIAPAKTKTAQPPADGNSRGK